MDDPIKMFEENKNTVRTYLAAKGQKAKFAEALGTTTQTIRNVLACDSESKMTSEQKSIWSDLQLKIADELEKQKGAAKRLAEVVRMI